MKTHKTRYDGNGYVHMEHLARRLDEEGLSSIAFIKLSTGPDGLQKMVQHGPNTSFFTSSTGGSFIARGLCLSLLGTWEWRGVHVQSCLKKVANGIFHLICPTYYVSPSRCWSGRHLLLCMHKHLIGVQLLDSQVAPSSTAFWIQTLLEPMDICSPYAWTWSFVI